MAFSNVVLPEPDDPIIAVKVPGASDAEIDASSGRVGRGRCGPDLDSVFHDNVRDVMNEVGIIELTVKLRTCTSTGTTSFKLNRVLADTLCSAEFLGRSDDVLLGPRRIALNPPESTVSVGLVSTATLA